MPKFYVESGPVKLIFAARDEKEAAIKAFQWTCDRQATLDAPTALEHVVEAEARGWQLHEEIHVHERGFGRFDGTWFETLDIVEAWQGYPLPLV